MAKRYVSFDEVKLRVGMEQVLSHYGLSEAVTGRGIRVRRDTLRSQLLRAMI